MGLIPGLGRSPGEGNGNPLQYSCLENPIDGRAWWATVHGVAWRSLAGWVAQSWTWLKQLSTRTQVVKQLTSLGIVSRKNMGDTCKFTIIHESSSAHCQKRRAVKPILLRSMYKWNEFYTLYESESEVAQSCPTLCDPVNCSMPGSSLSMEFSRQESWSGLPLPSPGDLPNPGIEPRSPALQADFHHLSHKGSPMWLYAKCFICIGYLISSITQPNGTVLIL